MRRIILPLLLAAGMLAGLAALLVRPRALNHAESLTVQGPGRLPPGP